MSSRPAGVQQRLRPSLAIGSQAALWVSDLTPVSCVVAPSRRPCRGYRQYADDRSIGSIYAGQVAGRCVWHSVAFDTDMSLPKAPFAAR